MQVDLDRLTTDELQIVRSECEAIITRSKEIRAQLLKCSELAVKMPPTKEVVEFVEANGALIKMYMNLVEVLSL